MKKSFVVAIISLLLGLQLTKAQNVTIKGIVHDKIENKGIEYVVVALINTEDSSLYKFIRSDKNGFFNLENIKNGKYTLITTHPLYADYIDSIIINNRPIDFGKIVLLNKSKLLEAVIVKNTSPIRMKGDTTVYTADSFKVKDGANIEDLLRKMPGFQVSKNGNIKAMGETVKNVLVDGEEFFGNDPGMALKNLQANIVQEVQVYDKKSDQATFTGIDDGVREKTINLKLKSNKKQGYFGKIEAGGGLPDRFNNNAIINAFKGKRKLSTFGFMGNTGKTNLSWDDSDKYGTGQSGDLTFGTDNEGNTVSYYSDNSESYSNGENGIPQNWNTGVHYSNKYHGDSLNINSSYRYSKINAPASSSSFSKTFLPDTSWSNNNYSTSFISKIKNNVSITFENKIDTNNTLKFIGSIGLLDNKGFSNYYEENLNSNVEFINNSSRNFINTINQKKYAGTIFWNHKFSKPRRTFITTINSSFAKSNGNSFLISNNNFYNKGLLIKKDTIDQQINTTTNTKQLLTNIAYSEPLTKKLSLSFSYLFNINNNTNDKAVFKNSGLGKYDSKVDSLSNDFVFNKFSHRYGTTIRYVSKKLNANIGAAIENTKFDQENKSRNTDQVYKFNNIFPSAGMNLKLKGNKNIRFTYNGSTAAPTLQQLQPIFDNSNSLNIFKGNPNLKQSFRNSLYNSFNWNEPLSNRGIWAYMYFNTIKNDFTQYNTIDTLGRNVSQTINVDGNYSLNGSINYYFSVGEGKRKYDISINTSTFVGHSIDFVNTLKNVNKNSSIGLGINFSKYVEDKYDFSIAPQINFTNSKSSVNKTSSRNFRSLTGDADIGIQINSKTRFGTNAEFNFRQKDKAITANNDFIKWNADFKNYIYKKEMSVKIAVIDILNQNRGYDRDFGTYMSKESYYTTLKRYWLLSFGWEFTHNKKMPKQTSENITP